MILESLSFKSLIFSARQRIAMISDATEIMKWSSRTTPSTGLPSPTTIFLRTRSFISIQRFHTIWFVSICNALPCLIWLSNIAASRLFADVIAWKSPVKCKFSSSIGTTCAYPPPAAPPLIPKHGPREGSLNAIAAFFPILPKASPRPTEVVVFPSPAGVGLIAVTRISFPSSRSFTSSQSSSVSFVLYFPYISRSSSLMPSCFATSRIWIIFASCAISISDFIFILPSFIVIFCHMDFFLQECFLSFLKHSQVFHIYCFYDNTYILSHITYLWQLLFYTNLFIHLT